MATATVYGAHCDNINQQFSQLGVIGTLGTADVGGTAPTLPISVDATTGATNTVDLSGNRTATGTIGTVNGNVEINANDTGSAIVIVSGTWQGKVEIQGSIDSVWVTLSIVQPTGLLIRTGINNDSQNGSYRIPLTAAYTKIRAIATTLSSGSVSVQFHTAREVGANFVFQLNQANLLTTAYQSAGTNLHMVMEAGTVGTVSNVGMLHGGTINAGTIVMTNGTTVGDSLAPYQYNKIVVDYTDGTTEKYAYAMNSGTLGTITVTYLDAAKGSISTVIKTP